MYPTDRGAIRSKGTTMATIETISPISRQRPYDISEVNGSRFSLLSMVEWLERQFEKRRSRLALLEMNDEQLKDIGLSRSDAYGEAKRRFWD
jgi:uncharacterized protein YjiS (DUF1127 family)